MALSWISGYNNINYLNQMIRSVEDTLSNDYNDLDNIPIIKIISSTSNPQNVWELKEGMYLIDGIVYVDNNTSYEVSNLFVSMTARLENGKYVLSAFIPFFKGLYEYILKSNSTEYEEHQIVILATHERMLTRYNETPYEPNGDYNPATKKYVDDKANEIVTELDRIGVNKETTTSLKEENRIRDIKLQALLSETSDRNISISEDTRYFDMPLSIDDGIVTINEMIGDTLVNVCDQEESVAITKSYTVENENHIALQGEYDGSCKPVVYGNTLVNHNADWDDSLQTGIETSAEGTEDVEIEGIRGQEVSVVVEGNTVLNHALGKTSAVVSAIKENLIDIVNVNPGGWIQASAYYNPKLLNYKGSLLIINNSDKTIRFQLSNLDGSYASQTMIDSNTTVSITIEEDKLFRMIQGHYDDGWTESDVDYFKESIKTFDATKYVNSNNGNYVDLTVANDMSSVVEIEGRTMVNVCDQKDPIAITKSYTVENSGNHIALQGEYDGKCRPVIQGNTMVNLFNISDIHESQGMRIDNNTITLTEENTWAYFGSHIPTLKPSTSYTFVVNVIENTTNDVIFINNAGEGETYFPEIPWKSVTEVGTYTYTATTASDLTNLRYSVRTNSKGTGYVKLQIMIFEGDLTQTPELIPTEYVEGLKNSFEDGYIPENLMTTDVSETDGDALRRDFSKHIYKSATVIIPSEYVGKLNIAIYKDNYGWFDNYSITNTIQHFSCNADEYYNCVSIAKADITLEELANLDIIVLEGDWTHLTEEDFNHLGRYKVEYKVTGKNKLNPSILNISRNQANTAWYVRYLSVTRKGNYVIHNNTDKQIRLRFGKTSDESWVKEPGINANSTMNFEITDDVTISWITLTDTNGWDTTYTFTEGDFWMEEGTEATEYEPYKEYTKTFYLNSPLLEGDTIEDVNGVATHVKRYGKVVLDGSDDEDWIVPETQHSEEYFRAYIFLGGNVPQDPNIICDKLPYIGYNVPFTSQEGIGTYYNKHINIKLLNTRYTSLNLEGVRQWLNSNPLTVVYQLASPQYEPISTESILCDSYVNGHLDFDSVVPIEKVKFNGWGTLVKYVYPSTKYIVQFESDSIGKLSHIGLNYNAFENLPVVKGVNSFTVTLGDTLNSTFFELNGIGFNASNIVVTEAVDIDFDYFEGLKSSYEYEVTEDGKYKVDVKVTGKNLFNINDIKDYTAKCVISGDKVTVIGDGTAIYKSVHAIVSVKKNTNYVLSYTSETIKGVVYVDIYDANFKYTAASGIFNSGDNDFVYVRFYCNTSTAIEGEVIYSNIQLEEGTEATSYEPYFESTKTFYLNSPLLEGDKIVTKNGKVYHYHKMGMVVLDGSESWANLGVTYPTLIYTLNIDDNCTISNELKCDTIQSRAFSTTESNYRTIYSTKNATTGLYCIRVQHETSSVSNFKQWLQANPTTVVYELASPYYELIDEYSNTILDIPNTVAHLTHTSAVPVNNTVFTNYKDELNVLEANTQYRVMFDCDKANVPFTVTLGGTSQEITSIKGTHSLLITTPSELVDKNLVIDGIGRCGIDNIRIFKGDVEYDYVKGLWSGYEERKLDIAQSVELWEIATNTGDFKVLSLIKPLTVYTIIFDIKTTKTFYCDKRLSMLRLTAFSDSSGYTCYGFIGELSTNYTHVVNKFITPETDYCYEYQITLRNAYHDYGLDSNILSVKNLVILEGDWTDNPPTYEEVMANEGKYAVKVKLDTNANIFGKGGRL